MRLPLLAASGAAIAVIASCTSASLEATEDVAAAEAEEATATAAQPAGVPPPSTAMAVGYSLKGEFEQGGWLRGQAPMYTKSVRLDGVELPLMASGQFFAGFDRDARPNAELEVTLPDGQVLTRTLAIKPREWNIQHIDAAKGTGGGSEAWWAKREPEWLAIRDARAKDTRAMGWVNDFIWPVKGRISGHFGRQRVYRGEPANYHSGIDIAPGNGTPFVAPADGVVVLARTGFSLEGNIIIIDHGGGLNSAFLHASKIAVSEGQKVRQGEHIGNVGATGRVTGPHLHWSLMWREARVDPLLFAGPMN